MTFSKPKVLILFFTLSLIFFVFPKLSYADTLGPLSPGTMADNTATGTAVWVNVNNALTSNDVYTTATSVCFVAGTKIKTADGEVNIESLTQGQYVLGFDTNEVIKNSRVRALSSREVDEVIQVVTDAGEVTVTAEHPFYIGHGNFEQIQNIRVGDYIYDNNFQRRQVLSKTPIHSTTTVYNLEVEDTHTYFANTFAVHNKTVWHFLHASNFGFSIPSGSTINGIRAGVEFKTGNNSLFGTDEVRIVKGGSVGSSVKTIFNNNMPLTDTYTYYGSASDLWGETWTADDINSSTFGFAFSVNIQSRVVSVDHMTLEVDYTLPDTTAPSVTLDTPTIGSTISGSAVSLSATASDDISIAGVKFYIDGTLIGSEDTTSAYTSILDTTPFDEGSHSIVAVARDTSNNFATSTTATVTIQNIIPAPQSGGGSGYIAGYNPYIPFIFTPPAPVAPTITFMNDLYIGKSSEEVLALQKFLNANGFTLSQDGAGSPGKETPFFGSLTKAALIRFQIAHEIKPAAGYFGPITRAKLNKLLR